MPGRLIWNLFPRKGICAIYCHPGLITGFWGFYFLDTLGFFGAPCGCVKEKVALRGDASLEIMAAERRAQDNPWSPARFALLEECHPWYLFDQGFPQDRPNQSHIWHFPWPPTGNRILPLKVKADSNSFLSMFGWSDAFHGKQLRPIQTTLTEGAT